MNYYEAAKIRKKGFADLMTDKLTSGQGVFSSARSALSDRSKARSMAFKEKFDPLNIAKVLTGGSNLAPAMLGRLLGRKSSDINYFAGKKEYTPRRESSYFNNYTAPSMSSGDSQKATRVLQKMLSFMEKSRTDDMQEQDTLDSFREMNENMRENRHKEVVNVFIEATKARRKAMKNMAKEAKKRQAREKAETKTGTPLAPFAPVQTAPPAKTAPPTKTPPPAKTEPAKNAANAKKPADTAKKQESTPKNKSAEKVKEKNSEAPSAKPSSSPPSRPTATKTGNKIAISAAAALSIERETGKPASAAIKNVGQIVSNDPESGRKSYGVFGINSGGSVQTFVKDNPQFDLSAKPASEEFDKQWTKISKELPEEMLNAQLKWYDKNVEQPTKNMKGIPFINDPAVQIYMSDRYNQYGGIMLKSALKYAKKAKTPEEFIKLMSEFDIREENLKKSFPTSLETHPNILPGLKARVREREKAALKQIASQNGNVSDNSQNGNVSDNSLNVNAASLLDVKGDLSAASLNDVQKAGINKLFEGMGLRALVGYENGDKIWNDKVNQLKKSNPRTLKKIIDAANVEIASILTAKPRLSSEVNDSNLGEKLSLNSIQNIDMKKDMSQGSSDGGPVIIQNNNTTQAKTNIHRAAPEEELNPTMR